MILYWGSLVDLYILIDVIEIYVGDTVIKIEDTLL